MKRYNRRDPVLFIEAWMSTESVTDASKKLGWDMHATSAYAAFLRKKGVDVPRHTKHKRARIDVAALNKLIRAKHNGH